MSSMAWLTPLQVAVILVVISTYILYIKWLRSKYPLGPWPLPIIGNMHQLSPKSYFEFTKMSKVYGPVFTVWMAGRPNVVLSDLHHVKEATIQRGLDFADRSMDTIGFKIVSNDNAGMISRSYDDKVSLFRSIALSVMKIKFIGGLSVLKIIEEEMQQLRKTLADSNGKPVDPSIVARLPASNVITRAVLNLRFENEEDPEYVRWKQANEKLKLALNKAVLLSLASGLAHFMRGTQNSIRTLFRDYDEFIEGYVKRHHNTYQDDVIRDLTDAVIQYQRNQGDDILPSQKITSIDVRGFVSDMLSAGILTTVATLTWSFLALLHRRDVQHKIQLELDHCLQKKKSNLTTAGNNPQQQSDELLFSRSDKPDLPYLNAFIHEVLRLCPAAPMGLPHRSTADTSVGAHSIPKGTDIIFNIYGIHRDGAIWENPQEFIPDRFLDKNGQFDHIKGKRLITFGAGPRSCAGENLARLEIFIYLANVLHTFDLYSPSAEKLPPLDDGRYGMDYLPYPFQLIFKLRQASTVE